MNKKLLAAAVAGAFAAPAAALAQGATVQVYGKITMEYGYADQGAGRPNADVMQFPGASGVGFRGEEKLGGGLAAWFQCESSADIRGVGQFGFCTQNSAIGLKGAYGNVFFGRWDTPFKRAMPGMVGAADTGLLGASFVFSGNSTSTGATGGIAPLSLSRNIWKRRESSLTYYESPVFSGFQVLAAFSAANATSATNASTAAKPRVQSIAGTYVNGPFALALGYERHSDFGSAGGGNSDRGWTIGAAYTFASHVKLGAQYLDTRYETSSTQDLTKKSWMLGVEWNVAGPHNLDAAYVRAGDSKGTATTNPGLGGGNGPVLVPNIAGTGAKLWEIGYRYTFSKRTLAKFGYVKLDNDRGATYSLGGLAAPTIAGENQSAWVLYTQHLW